MLKQKWNHARDEKGFTLTEMLIVVAIIALLGTFLTRSLMGKLDRAKVDTAKTQIRSLGTQLDQFKMDCGFYPLSDQGLEALLTKPTGGRECKNYDPNGYLGQKRVPNDPWNNPYAYESDGSKYVIKSLGADGKEGGEANNADISSEEL